MNMIDYDQEIYISCTQNWSTEYLPAWMDVNFSTKVRAGHGRALDVPKSIQQYLEGLKDHNNNNNKVIIMKGKKWRTNTLK